MDKNIEDCFIDCKNNLNQLKNIKDNTLEEDLYYIINSNEFYLNLLKILHSKSVKEYLNNKSLFEEIM